MNATVQHMAEMFQPQATDPATTDPLVGTQADTYSRIEAGVAPDREVALHHDPHGRPRRSARVATALAFLLGGLGAHRFYLGYRTVGLFQAGLFIGGALLVTVIAVATGSPLGGALLAGVSFVAVVHIWGVVEGLMILTGGLAHDAQDHPLRA